MRPLLLLVCVAGVCCATPTCTELHKSQLASLSERMSQMLSSLHPPLSPKSETSPEPPEPVSSPEPAADQASSPYKAYYPYPPYSMPAPQFVYVSPPQYPPQPVPFMPPAPLDGKIPFSQPFDFAYSGFPDMTPPWANYYDRFPNMQYQPQQYPPAPSAPPSYAPLLYPQPYPFPEYSVYPNMPAYPAYQPPTLTYPPPAYSPPAYSPPAYSPPPLPPPAYSPPAYPSPAHPPPAPYASPLLYHKSSEISTPPFYL